MRKKTEGGGGASLDGSVPRKVAVGVDMEVGAFTSETPQAILMFDLPLFFITSPYIAHCPVVSLPPLPPLPTNTTTTCVPFDARHRI